MKTMDCVSLFCKEKQESGSVSASTIVYYLNYLRGFLIKENLMDKDINSVTIENVNNWIKSYINDNKLTTLVKKRMALHSFFSWCYSAGLTKKNILAGYKMQFLDELPLHQKEKRSRKVITDSELHNILIEARKEIAEAKALVDKNNIVLSDDIFFNFRMRNLNHRLVIVQYYNACFCECAIIVSRYTGLRLMDIASLEWESINENHLVVWTHKTNTRVVIPTNKLVRDILAKQQKIHPIYIFPFISRKTGTPSSLAILSRKIGDIYYRAGIIDKNFHDLRATFITSTIKSGIEIPLVMKMVGHKNLQTTLSYVNYSYNDIEELSNRLSIENLAIR